MAQHRSAEKAARQAERRHLRNRSVTSAVKTHVRKAERLIGDGQLVSAEAAVLEAVKALDRAAQKGILHNNNAARRKSRLMEKYNAINPATSSN